jgi:hypothetical protein
VRGGGWLRSLAKGRVLDKRDVEIDLNLVLGRGAFGVVYGGTMAAGRELVRACRTIFF